MPGSTIYLDNNATTRPRPDVVEAMSRAFAEAYANPGSRHAAGRRARQALEEARESIAQILNAAPGEVIFTSGGTEASNMALFGFARGPAGTVALPPGEHPATEESVRVLESRGWKRVTLPIDSSGRLRQEALDELPWNDIRLATILLAHNETGTIQDISRFAQLCGEHRLPLHVDAVQAVGKISVDFHGLNATSLAVGAHKFCGPRGIGALLLRDGAQLAPTCFGGHQEAGRRPGTECVALAVGMAKALELWHAEREELTARLRELRNRLLAGLTAECPPVIVNGALDLQRGKTDPQDVCLPNTLSIAFPGCSGDALMVALDLEGVCCSLGSTCASGSSEPAPILVAMNRSPEVYDATLRFSIGRENTEEEIDEAVRRIARVVARARQSSGA
jgi:cysteine desulfurase